MCAAPLLPAAPPPAPRMHRARRRGAAPSNRPIGGPRRARRAAFKPRAGVGPPGAAVARVRVAVGRAGSSRAFGGAAASAGASLCSAAELRPEQGRGAPGLGARGRACEAEGPGGTSRGLRPPFPSPPAGGRPLPPSGPGLRRRSPASTGSGGGSGGLGAAPAHRRPCPPRSDSDSRRRGRRTRRQPAGREKRRWTSPGRTVRPRRCSAAVGELECPHLRELSPVFVRRSPVPRAGQSHVPALSGVPPSRLFGFRFSPSRSPQLRISLKAGVLCSPTRRVYPGRRTQPGTWQALGTGVTESDVSSWCSLLAPVG